MGGYLQRLGCMLCAAFPLVACGGGGGGRMSDSSATLGPGTGGPTATGDGTATASDTGGCPEARVCPDECCPEGQACVDDACIVDCGANDPCGADEVCCADGEVCSVGQCVTPGGACSGAACATSLTAECEESEVCDPDLQLCVPNLADFTCVFAPEVGVFDPVPRFTWGVRQPRDCSLGCQKEEVCNAGTCEPTWPHVTIAVDDLPEFHQVVMSPMVADLDADCVPEIIFNSYQNSAYQTNGVLRVIRGDTGAKVWTLSDAMYRTDPGSHPAIGDLDGDGIPEIITSGQGNNLIAVSNTGLPLWISDNYSFGNDLSGSPSIANFDNTGDAEVAFGNSVWNSTGNIIYAGAGAMGSNGSVGPLSCVADLTGDGRPELVAGATAHTFTGTVGVDFMGSVLWTGAPANGYCGIADFQLDGTPEVVTVNSNAITVFNGQSGVVMASIAIPGGGAGGPPNIADFDGDGTPDIGTAGGTFYVVVQFNGVDTLTELWRADTIDGSSQRTGSSVFDFDGDGRSEVIYGDEQNLRIYPGTEPSCPGGAACDGTMADSETLFVEINSSRTRSEYPIIADVDGDFKAEIVVSTNNESNQGSIGDAGIEVFEDRLDNWVATLPIWNQHTYHVTNIEKDTSVPNPESDNWTTPPANPHNSYRRNTQGDLASLCAPDLVPTDLQVDTIDCPDLEIMVKVLNQGCLGVGPGVNVAFYDADIGLLGVVQTAAAIPAGGAVGVSLSVTDPGDEPFEIHVVVDDDGMGNGALNECVEDNNATEPATFCEPAG